MILVGDVRVRLLGVFVSVFVSVCNWVRVYVDDLVSAPPFFILVSTVGGFAVSVVSVVSVLSVGAVPAAFAVVLAFVLALVLFFK